MSHIYSKQMHLNIARKAIPLPFFFLLLFLMEIDHPLAAQQSDNICQTAHKIIQTSKKYHYQPREINDEFSKNIYSHFIRLLDADNFFLTREDLQSLAKFKSGIDEEIKNKECKLPAKASKLYHKKLLFADSVIRAFQNQRFDYQTRDTLHLGEHHSRVRDSKALIQKWKKRIKLRVLSSFFANDSLEDPSDPLTQKHLARYKNEVINGMHCHIKSRLNKGEGPEAFVRSCFLKSLASAFDPHSNYFSKTDKKAFTNALSSSTYSFGFQLQKNDLGEMEIAHIMPAGPAWNSNRLNEGDVILSVKTGKEQEDFRCISRKEAHSFLLSDNIKQAEFHIRKKNRKEIRLRLKKARVDAEQNAIRSFIIKGEKDLGYIYLPSFYTGNDDNLARRKGCANDLAKELIKLKRQGISGLIIDLRDNGGGSMMQAILMSGIFINFGTVSLVQRWDQEPQSLKDMNRGTIYNDPMVIMVNEFSASASELFAAAMQDFNRAVIVGASTYGKATMQEILPVDIFRVDEISSYSGNPKAFLKLTTAAFYRVTGKSHQKTGVHPDIPLPSLYDSLQIGERSYQTALSPQTLNKKTYYRKLHPLPCDSLQKLSAQRLKNDSTFARIKTMGQQIAGRKTSYRIPLNFYAFEKYRNSIPDYELPDNDPVFLVENPSYLKGISSLKDSNKVINQENILQIKNDIYVDEAYHIMLDLIQLTKL